MNSETGLEPTAPYRGLVSVDDSSPTGRVILVGAGPGDPELITVKGARALASADVVVVDRLVPPELIEGLAGQIVPVGKQPLHHPIPQRQIEAILIEHASAGKTVVRLKGGDPFLLGRGGEEMQACRAAGIPVEVIPGVTSALSVPGVADTPLTYRRVAKAVTITSGHEDLDYPALAAVGGTLVVLMGMTRLHEIAAGLIRAGMSADTPAVVVERGFSPEQQTARAPLSQIAMTCSAEGVGPPAVIVIGEVALGLEELARRHPLEPLTPRSPRAS